MFDFPKEEGILDCIPNPSPNEKTVLEKPPLETKYGDHTILKEILEKLAHSSNKKAMGFCRVRYALAFENSRIPPKEKALAWNLAANALAEAKLPYSHILSTAASYWTKDGEHVKAAQLYETSANLAFTEEIPDNQILTWFRESRRLYEISGNSDLAGKVFFLESDYKLKTSDGLKKIWLYFFKYLCGYGESPARVVAIATIVILGCALSYTL